MQTRGPELGSGRVELATDTGAFYQSLVQTLSRILEEGGEVGRIWMGEQSFRIILEQSEVDWSGHQWIDISVLGVKVAIAPFLPPGAVYFSS